MTTVTESYQFQAETKQLLDLMINSLYTNREIFLRELISNASDALDRLKFESLSNAALLEDDERFEIRLETDRQARTLTISDTGIGMSREEVISNIGTIAKSGTRELRERLKEGKSEKLIAELIGQFGVGFYSSFMVADKVTLVTRKAGEEAATVWESSGDGFYTLGETTRASRGTSITLSLKPVDPDNGIEDFTDKWILMRIVKRYSDFVSYPIIYRDEREEVDKDEFGNTPKDAKPTTVIEDKTLNSIKPIWARPESEVTESDYAEFYKHITHDLTDPMKAISVKAEGRYEYYSLLFIPSNAPYDLFYHAAETGLRLYARRVLIMEKCEELLPRYLRFIKGVVDSADLPLNISRQRLQQDQHITVMRKWLTKKVLDSLKEMYSKEYDKYLQFWEQFGRALKEGVSFDYDNKEKIIELLLFPSSSDPEKLTTLKDYVERMKEGQKEIFYLTGESRKVVENSPHLEAFKEKQFEVLYLIEPVDELVVQAITDYEGKKLKSIGKGRVALEDEDEQRLKQQEEQYADLLSFMQEKLDKYVRQVRLTNRLTVSPACLVVGEFDYSPQLERLLMKDRVGGSTKRPVLELNPGHQVIEKMRAKIEKDKEDPALADYAHLLLGSALLAEGSELPDPVEFNRLLVELIAHGL